MCINVRKKNQKSKNLVWSLFGSVKQHTPLFILVEFVFRKYLSRFILKEKRGMQTARNAFFVPKENACKQIVEILDSVTFFVFFHCVIFFYFFVLQRLDNNNSSRAGCKWQATRK